MCGFMHINILYVHASWEGGTWRLERGGWLGGFASRSAHNKQEWFVRTSYERHIRSPPLRTNTTLIRPSSEPTIRTTGSDGRFGWTLIRTSSEPTIRTPSEPHQANGTVRAKRHETVRVRNGESPKRPSPKRSESETAESETVRNRPLETVKLACCGGADERGADERGADERDADERDADERDADERGADERCAD